MLVVNRGLTDTVHMADCGMDGDPVIVEAFFPTVEVREIAFQNIDSVGIANS